jgi:arylsulfatase A-like enzyme
MNVLFLMTDQQRMDTAGCYGHPIVQTPCMDALARTGVRMNNAFCVSPLCGPSRASVLTGTYPHTHGLVTHPNKRHRSGKPYRPQMQPGIGSLLVPLRDAGYSVHLSGYLGLHMYRGNREAGTDPQFNGATSMRANDYAALTNPETARQYNLAGIHSEMWEPSYFNVEGEPSKVPEQQMWDTLVADDVIAFLDEQDASKPFYAYAGFRAPHPPWCAPQRFHEMYDPDNIGPLPNYTVQHKNKPRRLMERFDYFDIRHYDEQMVRRSIAAYYAFVSYVDHCAGRIVAKLEERGLRDNTLIIFSSDHGENLYRHGLCEKHSFFEDALRVPLIFSLPGVLPQGEQRDGLVENMDTLPTVLSMVGLDVPDFVEGRDLQPLMHEGTAVRDRVFAEYYHTLDPCRMVRDERYKYIHTEEDICELYDLELDPDERINLAWYPQYAQRVERMDALVMDGWEIPDVPIHAGWYDLNERKQKQRLKGMDIIDPRPPLPERFRS